MEELIEEVIDLGELDDKFYAIVGRADENLKRFTEIFKIKITARGTELHIKGPIENVNRFVNFINSLLKELETKKLSSKDILDMAIYKQTDIPKEEKTQEPEDFSHHIIFVTHRRKAIVPKTKTQDIYVRSIRKNDVVFGVGPAGTGKTYLAMACALSDLKEQKVNKIILTRPAVEAGEKLGYLPGSIAEKVDPYLRPLYDALYDMLDYEKALHLLERNIIEIAPLAFMRGRTLNEAFIILDEAQNSTKEQMKMFLTRIGFGSKVVITGDTTQIDLPNKSQSGLIQALKVLKGIEGIDMIFFKENDVVRHPIVQRIVKAYEKFEEENEQSKSPEQKKKEDQTS